MPRNVVRLREAVTGCSALPAVRETETRCQSMDGVESDPELALRFSEVEMCVNKQQEDMKKMGMDSCRRDNTVIWYDSMERHG